jgi:flagellar basal body-associated protein FliL
MSKILSPKIIIPLLVSTLLLGLVAYTLLAPATWWKPLYVRVEMEETSTPAAEAHQPANVEPVATAELQAAGHVSRLQPSWGIMYALDSKVVNLAEPGGLRYLQASIVLEFYPQQADYYQLADEERKLAEEELGALMDSHRPVMDDIAMTILSSKSYSEIATVEGKDALKQELQAGINESLGYPAIANVYFTEFVVQ